MARRGGTAMNSDKDKSVIDKFKDTVSEAVENMASAMRPTPEESQKKVAATTNEQFYIPDATDAAAMPPPLFAPLRKRKSRAKTKPTRSATKSAKSGRKKSAKKASKAPSKSAKKAKKKKAKKSKR
jgi:hypothetical protein